MRIPSYSLARWTISSVTGGALPSWTFASRWSDTPFTWAAQQQRGVDVVWLIPFPSTTTIEILWFFPLPWLIIGGLCFWVVGGLKGMWVPICWPAKAARWRCCQALMGISHWKRMECSVASGHLTKSYWKWPSRNSGFTMIYPLKNGGSFHSYVSLPEGNQQSPTIWDLENLSLAEVNNFTASSLECWLERVAIAKSLYFRLLNDYNLSRYNDFFQILKWICLKIGNSQTHGLSCVPDWIAIWFLYYGMLNFSDRPKCPV